MKSPLDAMIERGVVPPVNFPPDSRYFGSGTLTYTTADGQSVTYLARRFVPLAGAPNFSPLASHTVRNGDRLDLLAARYYGDPLMSWLIADANGAVRPEELCETAGRVLMIGMPRGVPGVPNA